MHMPPDRRCRSLVAIPAYNEAATIRGVVDRVRADLPDCDVLVVNDGSDDETAAARLSPATCAIWDTAAPFKPPCCTRRAKDTTVSSRSTPTASTIRRRFARS